MVQASCCSLLLVCLVSYSSAAEFREHVHRFPQLRGLSMSASASFLPSNSVKDGPTDSSLRSTRDRRRLASSPRGEQPQQPEQRRLKRQEDDDGGGGDDEWTDDQAFEWGTDTPTPGPTDPPMEQQPPLPPIPTFDQQQPEQPPPPPPQEDNTGGSEDPNGSTEDSNEMEPTNDAADDVANTSTTAPAIEGSDTTADLSAMVDREQICRAAAQGNPLTTPYGLTVSYTMDLRLNDEEMSPIFVGMAVNSAVTDYLSRAYIEVHCTDATLMQQGQEGDNSGNQVSMQQEESPPNRLLSRTLQDASGSSSIGNVAFFSALNTNYGDAHTVWGVTGGTTQRAEASETCDETAIADDAALIGGTCYRLTTSNRIYFGNATSDFADMATAILLDIATVFSSEDNSIVAAIQASGDADTASTIEGLVYVNGMYDDGENGARSSASVEREGMRPAGKAFLSLFLLGFVAVAGFAGYKYGYPKYREHQWKKKHNPTSSSAPFSPATATRSSPSHTDRDNDDDDRPNAATTNTVPAWTTFPSTFSLDSIRQRIVPAARKNSADDTPLASSDESSSAAAAVSTHKRRDTAALAADINKRLGSQRRKGNNVEAVEAPNSATPKIVLEDTSLSAILPMDGTSDGAYGTETILDDWQDPTKNVSRNGGDTSTLGFINTTATSSFRYSPTKILAKIEKRTLSRRSASAPSASSAAAADRAADEVSLTGAETVDGGDYNFSQDAFSFSDINIIVDDSSTVASISPLYLQAAKRNYAVPDTVNL